MAAEQARDEAQAATGTVVMTNSQIGVGKPDGTTMTVDQTGTFSAKVIVSGEDIEEEA